MSNEIRLSLAYYTSREFHTSCKLALTANEKIHDLLVRNNIPFKVWRHEETLTSQESANVRGVPLASGAKSMICSINKTKLIMCVISAQETINFSLLKKYFNTKDLSLASVEQVWKATNCKIGAVPPFGSIFNLALFIDPSLIEQGKTINFNSGLRNESIQILVEDYLKVEPLHTMVSFANKKEAPL